MENPRAVGVRQHHLDCKRRDDDEDEGERRQGNTPQPLEERHRARQREDRRDAALARRRVVRLPVLVVSAALLVAGTMTIPLANP